MNYKTSRDLLLGTKALTEEQAEEILDMWEAKPRSYYDFLKTEDSFQMLQAYDGIYAGDTSHRFKSTKIRVPSISVARKFFVLKDADIITRFIVLINKLSVKEKSGEDVYAWPYLTKDCMSAIPLSQLFWVIGDSQYVFNFEDDRRGDLFDGIYHSLQYSLPRDVFAANSFNIAGWIKHARHYSPTEFNKHMLMASHCLAVGSCAEAVARKFYISYRLDILREMNDLEMKIAMPQSNVTIN